MLSLRVTDGEAVNLRDLRGRTVVLAFEPNDWSPVCSDQLSLYNELLPEFQRRGAALFGISVDSDWCHLAFADDRRLHFPLLADSEPKGEVARRYGVYRLPDGTSEHALFMIDGDGIIRWSYRSPVEINLGADGILTPLETMQVEEVTDDDTTWRPTQAVRLRTRSCPVAIHRADHAGRVRRPRVPVLQRGASDREASSGAPERSTALRLP
jgi:peroxiredoxin